MKKGVLALTFVALAGCTAVSVRPLAEKPQHMCIKRNPAVIIKSFLPVVQDGLARHGIASAVYDRTPRDCTQVLEYTARRSWDFGPYLSTADLIVRDQNRRVIATANYHLRGKGGFSLVKWASVKSKMDPVIDELLASAAPAPLPVAAPATGTATGPTKEQQLQELMNDNTLGYEEYMRRRRQIDGQSE